MMPALPTEAATAAQSCIDACSVVFLVTFVTALWIDTTTNLALFGFGAAIVSVVTDMFSPDDALRVTSPVPRAPRQEPACRRVRFRIPSVTHGSSHFPSAARR